MKKILHLFSIFWMILLMGSCATKKIYQSDLTQTSKIDSTEIYEVRIDSGSYADRYTHIYDSVITHVTIYRYDTVITISGDPILKEKIQIDQTKILKQEDLTQSGDSIQIITHSETDVARNDSIHQEVIMTKETKDGSSILSKLILILILALSMEICAIGWKIIRNK